MAYPYHIPRAHLVGVAALAIFSALVADYLWQQVPQRFPPLPKDALWDEISSVAGERWKVKGG